MTAELILLVEDDVNLRQSIALILHRAGYFVKATDSVFHAMGILRSAHYQLVISDVNMPETREVLLPKVMGDNPNLDIVVLTDQSVLEIETERKISGVHYLVKPIAPERLLYNIDLVLHKKNHR